ncbi:hypothetical protein [Desulfovibrio sp. JC022]|uniref:hypothetical protein n=1 Tax=Desulfovibrio sp. JC022 TaxID=2593642 RepID=UPI0013D47C72|nr:hypothetical protein [Desulfovibrio sp. JC022]NDV24535.1 hypothetical protein [Desulfovibrio sp. JC022]
MIKKIKAAITVAAIAGTCAVSGPAFAAWTSDAPNKLAANITAGAVTNSGNEGMVIVGSEGKIYRMSQDAMRGNDPQWSKRTTSVTEDFADAAYETTSSGYFWAVTTTGELVSSSDGSVWSVVGIADPAKAAIAGKTIVGLTTCGDGAADSDIVIATQDGVVIYYDVSASSWAVTAADLAGENIATAGVTGIKDLTGEDGKVVVFGKGGGNGNANNMYTLTLGSDTVVGFNVENCPNINDISIQAKGAWYVVGDTATAVKGAQDLDGLTANITTAKLALKQTDGTTSYAGTSNLLSIEYNSAAGLGYISGAEGSLFRLSGSEVVAKPSGSSEDLNDVNLVINGATKRAFASGNNGASMYGSESYWSDISSVTGLPGSGTPTPRSILAYDATFYMTDGSTTKLYASTNPSSSWTEVSTGLSGSISPDTYSKLVAGTTSSGDTYVAGTGSDGMNNYVLVYKVGDTTNQPGAVNIGGGIATSHLAVVNYNNEPILFKAASTNFGARNLGTISSFISFMGAGSGLSGGVQSLAASTNGLYGIDSGTKTTVYARVTNAGIDDHLDVSKTEVGPGWTAATDITTYIGTLGGATAEKLFSVTNGVVLVTSDGKLHLITDQAGADVTSNQIQIKALNCPATGIDAANKIGDISGSATDMTIVAKPGGADGPGIWHYTDSGGWENYKDLAGTLGISSPYGVAASGAKVVVYDFDELGYSAGNTFTAAVPSGALPVGTKISSVFNATKSEIYVAGQDGLLYNGTRKAGTDSIVWKEKRYNDSFFGANDFNKVSGAGDKVFVSYGTTGSGLAWKDLTATEWTEIGVDSGATGTVLDMHTLDSSTLYFGTSGRGLVKGVMSGNQITYTEQTKGTSGMDMPTGINALSVLDENTLYAIYSDHTGNRAYKFELASGDSWVITGIPLSDAPVLNDIIAISSEKVYIVGNNGYTAIYDGSSAIKLPAITGNPNLISCWAYEGFLYAADDAGKVHTYNVETKAWSTETVRNGVALADISGSSKGQYILTVGADSTSYLDEINSSGGGSKNNYVNPNSEDTAVVDSEVPVKRTPEVLTQTYGTPPEMAVISDVQQFTTTGGVVSGSTHTFTFNFTPTENFAFNEVILYKLKATGSNLTYNRLSAAPASPTSGDFWITTSVGGAIGAGDTLAAGTTYSVYFALADGSQYDDDSVAGKITDPAVLGTTSSSGSSGCVFNPAQTFGLEWLMLAFAPVAAFFRCRFKK